MRDNEQISDSLLYGHRKFDGQRRAERWLHVAYNAYCRLAPFRKMRAECKSYAYGKQYERQIVYNGRHITKEQYLKEKGIPALQTNILGKIKRVVQGQFRMNDTAPVCNAVDPGEKEYADIMSALLRQNMKLNRRSELDARTFEEYLISGLPIYKISWAYRRGKLDVFTDYVNPNFVFFPDSLDFNLADIRFCGLLHDLDFSEVLALFSHSDSDDIKLKEIYNHCLDNEYIPRSSAVTHARHRLNPPISTILQSSENAVLLNYGRRRGGRPGFVTIPWRVSLILFLMIRKSALRK